MLDRIINSNLEPMDSADVAWLRMDSDTNLMTFQRKHGLSIDHHTADSRRDGSPMDYDWAAMLVGQAETRKSSTDGVRDRKAN